MANRLTKTATTRYTPGMEGIPGRPAYCVTEPDSGRGGGFSGVGGGHGGGSQPAWTKVPFNNPTGKNNY